MLFCAEMRRERDDAVYKYRIAGRAPRDVMQGQAESVMPCVKKAKPPGRPVVSECFLRRKFSV